MIEYNITTVYRTLLGLSQLLVPLELMSHATGAL
jgi:hypothetical protein